MNLKLRTVLTLGLTLLISASAWAESVEIRLKNGLRWRGELQDQILLEKHGSNPQITGRLVAVKDLYIVVETDLAGDVRKMTIFKADIRSIKDAESKPGDSARKKPKKRRGAKSSEADSQSGNSDSPTVFLLPLEGMVGGPFRHQEIDKIGELADEAGPGQIIVLKIKSNGGMVYEADQIRESIEKLQESHRVVAWVDKAISAGCSTAMCCREIYFTTDGTAGSVTTLAGSTSIAEDEGGHIHVQALVDICVKNGYSAHIARAMKYNHYMCSYDKDEETGEVTFYGDMSGDYILSDDQSNLCFRSDNALHSGFSKGTANTTEELAKLLDLAEWRESGEGRKIAKKWQREFEDTIEQCNHLLAQLNYKNTGSGDMRQILGAQIDIRRKLKRLANRAPNIRFFVGIPEDWVIDWEIEDLQRQLAQIREAERRR